MSFCDDYCAGRIQTFLDPGCDCRPSGHTGPIFTTTAAAQPSATVVAVLLILAVLLFD